jgi:hypothetical protein
VAETFCNGLSRPKTILLHAFYTADRTSINAASRLPRRKKMPERKMVHWDATERHSVALEALKISRRNPKLSLRAIVSSAQVVLTEDRRRPIEKTQDEKLAAWLMPLWDEMQIDQKSQARPVNGVSQLFTPTTTAQAPAQSFATPAAPPGDDNRHASTFIGPPTASAPIGEPHDRRTSVHWKDEDKRKVAARAYYLLQNFPDMKRLEAVRKGMESELTDDKQRDITHWGMVSAWADPMIEQHEVEARLLQLEQQRARDATDNARRADAARIEAEKSRDAEAARARALETQASASVQIEKLSFEDLIRAFAAKLARETISAISSEFEKQMAGKITDAIANGTSKMETTPAEDEHLIAVPTDRLPLVGVVGLLNQQEDDVRRAFEGKIKFVFVKSQHEGGNNGGGHGMLEKCSRCDVVIAMTDHLGHDVDAASKKLNVPFKRLTGKVSSLKRYLSSWINGEVVLKAA